MSSKLVLLLLMTYVFTVLHGASLTSDGDNVKDMLCVGEILGSLLGKLNNQGTQMNLIQSRGLDASICKVDKIDADLIPLSSSTMTVLKISRILEEKVNKDNECLKNILSKNIQ